MEKQPDNDRILTGLFAPEFPIDDAQPKFGRDIQEANPLKRFQFKHGEIGRIHDPVHKFMVMRGLELRHLQADFEPEVNGKPGGQRLDKGFMPRLQFAQFPGGQGG